MKITITEALAEMKTLSSRVAKKQQGVQNFLVRPAQLRDPLEKQDGSVEYVRRERQAISDLQKRMLRIRTEIQKANLSTDLTVEGTTMRVQEWLNWRREIAPLIEAGFNQSVSTIAMMRRQAGKTGATVASQEDVVVNLNEQELHAEIENHQKVMGALDGKLSLINATTTVEVE